MARTRRPEHIPTLAYLRVSTTEQADTGAGLAAQRAAIAAYATAHLLSVDAEYVDAGVSGSVAPAQRPELVKALDVLRAARSGVLLVAKSDRCARKASDLLALCAQAEAQGWHVVAVDGSVDMTTSHGRFLTTVMAGVAELERDMIRSRTRDALAAKRAAGVRLGRPVALAQDVRDRIAREREAGTTLQGIADGLNADEIPTPRGGTMWRPSQVASVLASVAHDEYAAARR